MKLATLGITVVGALLGAGCVTEGVSTMEPASDEEQAEANLALGIGYIQEERPDLAIEALERSIALQPRMAVAHSMIALAYDQTQAYSLAEEHHRRATQLASGNADVQNGYAVFLCRRNRWEDAEPYFDRAIAVSNNVSPINVMMNAAACARGAEDFDAAARFFRAALDVDPLNVEALRGAMNVSIRSANFISGRAFWQRLDRATSLQAEDLLSCYVIEVELRDQTAAQSCASRLRQEFPGSPVLNQLRELERNAG